MTQHADATREKHTPRPWRVHRVGDYVEVRADREPVVDWRGFDDSGRDFMTHVANAEFIVRAVNVHDDLLAACKAAHQWTQQMNDETHKLLREAIAKAASPATPAAAGSISAQAPQWMIESDPALAHAYYEGHRDAMKAVRDAAPATPADEQVSESIDIPVDHPLRAIYRFESKDLRALADWLDSERSAGALLRRMERARAALASPAGDDALLARLEEIEARANATTPGSPTDGTWSYDDGITDHWRDDNGVMHAERGKLAKVEVCLYVDAADGSSNFEHILIAATEIDDNLDRRDANGNFIAHARADVPYLIAELRARLAASPRPAAARAAEEK